MKERYLLCYSNYSNRPYELLQPGPFAKVLIEWGEIYIIIHSWQHCVCCQQVLLLQYHDCVLFVNNNVILGAGSALEGVRQI